MQVEKRSGIISFGMHRTLGLALLVALGLLVASAPSRESGAALRRAHTQSVWNGDIYVVNADGTGRERLTRDPAEEFDPAWSPDGTKIAFLRAFQELGVNDRPIYVMNADGSDQHQLIPGTRLAAVPSWQARGVGGGN